MLIKAFKHGNKGSAQGSLVFKLRPYFLVTSLIGILAVLVALLSFYRYQAYGTLKDHEQHNNVTLAQVFSNSIWPRYAAVLKRAGQSPRVDLIKRPEFVELRSELTRLMAGVGVVKVKIFDVNGVTVFSTDPMQLADNKGTDPGFLKARNGVTVSEVTLRRRIGALGEGITGRDVVSSYVPIRQNEAGPVEGVFQVYSDVSNQVSRLNVLQWQVAAAVLGSLALLYFFLFLIVRRADRIITAQNAEERLAVQERLRHQASHDALTGLPNRAKFTERLEEAIRRAKRQQSMFAVMLVDLDHSKVINDSLGHHVGDLLLKAVSERLKICLRDTDIIARLGGDEFIILLSEMNRIDHVARLAEKLRDEVANEPYRLHDQELRVTPSIGISVFPDDSDDAMELIRNADAAMYYAKDMGRNNFQFYTHDMNARAFAILSLENSLRQALERQEFLLHYQPQIDIATQRVVGAEALIRWQHPDMGLVSPSQFIPIAEERGLIVPIGEWVLREACRQNRLWQNAGLPSMPVAVNVSAVQFRHADFPRKVAEILKETGLAPKYLELEITESVIMHGVEAAISTVQELKAAGIMLSIDDFGTGYSGFGYLKQFPVDRVKLDQSFVRGLPGDADDVAIAVAVLAMARSRKLQVVAEGVDTEDQLKFLRENQFDQIQGYYFSKPLSADEFARMVRGQLDQTHVSWPSSAASN